ncbi:MAG TPA: hypothetical protein VIY28_09265 [Pseudonocardiaceae bacterium]
MARTLRRRGQCDLLLADFVGAAGRHVRQLAWMVANVLDHTRLWFTNTDRHYVSDDEQPGRAPATDVVLGGSAEGNSSITD